MGVSDAGKRATPSIKPGIRHTVPRLQSQSTAVMDCVGLLLVALYPVLTTSTPAPTTVVVILTDDLDATLTPLHVAMPSLAARASVSGVKFTHSFVTTPVCCPSRSSILSGRYQHNT